MGKILLVLLLLGLVVYLTIRVIERRGIAPSRPQQRPLGPDDDPDFLRGLDPRPDRPDDDH